MPTYLSFIVLGFLLLASVAVCCYQVRLRRKQRWLAARIAACRPNFN